jgi:hypothetical protein
VISACSFIAEFYLPAGAGFSRFDSSIEMLVQIAAVFKHSLQHLAQMLLGATATSRSDVKTDKAPATNN